VTPELIERARAGDPDAFAVLIETRLERMYRLAMAILGHDADARDAVQDAMAATWRDLPSLRDPERFGAWSDRILVNACRLTLRRRARGRVREVALHPGGDLADPPGLPAVAPPDEVTAAQDELERAFEQLSIDERALLVLHHLDELPLAAIAERLGIPVGTAKSRLHHARRALERALDRGRP
jgi:RNA polymerase sigma-70 factor (ECF subfamily)